MKIGREELKEWRELIQSAFVSWSEGSPESAEHKFIELRNRIEEKLSQVEEIPTNEEGDHICPVCDDILKWNDKDGILLCRNCGWDSEE